MRQQQALQHYRKIETDLFSRLVRRPPSGLIEHAAIRLVFLCVVTFTLGISFPGTLSKLCLIAAFIFLGLLFCCLTILLFRWIFAHILWKVRNRLIVTCLLMGLAPILLFGTLAGIAAYVFAGQFGTSSALNAIDDDLALALNRAGLVAHAPLPLLRDRKITFPGEHTLVDAWQDGKPLIPATPSTVLPSAFASLPAPAWLHPGFKGIVALNRKLYLCAAGGAQADGHAILVLESSPFAAEQVNTFAAGLGTLAINPGFNLDNDPPIEDGKDQTDAPENRERQEGSLKENDPTKEDTRKKTVGEGTTQNAVNAIDVDPDVDHPAALTAPSEPKTPVKPHRPDRRGQPSLLKALKPPPPRAMHPDSASFVSLHGGVLSTPLNLFDAPIYASIPFPITSWQSGQTVPAWMMIVSRPSLLYKRLFSTSVKGGIFVRIALIVTGSVFGIVELFALLMAIGLIRTITQSVADLYFATRQVEGGNLAHRILVRRRDQLAALATSFNTMSGSLAELLEHQREKDRMQNELNIAHEVQNNLFPHTPIGLPGLELYGICNPARTIGGDYYDFIPMGAQQVYLALGDISGKGISAALLMSSLHSAVRVYLHGESRKTLSAVTSAEEPLPSPGKLLSLLNRHLYSSTQPEKYATLFLASYDSQTRRLTYSNGGHLPPLVLCESGEVQRLEAGGSVVGLLAQGEYAEATVQLHPGDLLIAYSDGLTEPEKDGEEFGEQRLIDVIRNNLHRPLPVIANYTVQCLKDWMGEGEQPDDITIVFARLT